MDGKAVTAVGVGGTILTGTQAACANCHRRSGYGSSEGGMLAPPVTGKLLFRDRDFQYRELKRNMSRPITRPAYDLKSLARALSQGIAANDRPLKPLMPRYSLSRFEVGEIKKYLQVMGKDEAIGIDKDSIHLASVITPDVPLHRRKAMLATLETYVTIKNADTREELSRAEKSPWHKSWKYEAYRKWKLHLWELKGSPADWAAQLERYYSKQPVFAMVSGIGTEHWQPVHEFCESNRIPCLFPSIDIPGESREHYYSIYFSQGIKLEAAAIIQHLAQTAKPSDRAKIIQVIDGTEKSHRAAKIFTALLGSHAQAERYSMVTGDVESVARLVRNTGSRAAPKNILVSWVPVSRLMTLDDKLGDLIDRIYVPSTGPGAHAGKHGFKSQLYMVHPYTLPAKLDRSLLRATSWANIHHVSPVDKEITANSYFAMTLLTRSINHLRSNFSRNYLIERIEHMLDNNVFDSVYPHLSLGPDQRHASKGCYIIGPLQDPSLLSKADKGQWIVP